MRQVTLIIENYGTKRTFSTQSLNCPCGNPQLSIRDLVNYVIDDANNHINSTFNVDAVECICGQGVHG